MVPLKSRSFIVEQDAARRARWRRRVLRPPDADVADERRPGGKSRDKQS